jgi:hypothetical protein
MSFNLKRYRADRLTEESVITELKRVAEYFGYRRYSRHDFDSVSSTCKGSVVIERFGSWDAALAATKLSLTPYRRRRKDRIPTNDLLSELARIWELLGHRPSKTEWENSDAKYSYTTYKTRFGGWLNACKVIVDEEPLREANKTETARQTAGEKHIPKERSRYVPLKVRLAVLKRDRFRCVLCGRSPATHSGVTLHLDHKIPYSNGGETTQKNLHALCQDCNWGKGNDAKFNDKGT